MVKKYSSSYMVSRQLKLPKNLDDEARQYCAKRTESDGKFYSFCEFAREAISDKMSLVKQGRNERRG